MAQWVSRLQPDWNAEKPQQITTNLTELKRRSKEERAKMTPQRCETLVVIQSIITSTLLLPKVGFSRDCTEPCENSFYRTVHQLLLSLFKQEFPHTNTEFSSLSVWNATGKVNVLGHSNRLFLTCTFIPIWSSLIHILLLFLILTLFF